MSRFWWQRAIAFGLCLLWLCTLGGRPQAQQVAPYINWTPPAPITFPAPLSPIQLNASVTQAPPVPVPLGGVYNISGITTPGYSFLGGFDDGSWAYAEETLGSSILWNGISFPIGPADAPDAISGVAVPLPAGHFGTLLVLGDLVNSEMPPVAHFTVTYTDGTTATITQSLSDWVIPKNYPGETLVHCAPYRRNSDGSEDPNSVCVYGYQFPLDPTKTPVSFTLPNDRDVVLLSLMLLPPAVPGALTYTPPQGTVLNPGNHELSASFAPDDPSTFSSASATVPLQVLPAASVLSPMITWPQPAPIVFGSPLPAADLNASALVPEGPVIVPLGPTARVDAFYPDGEVYLEKGFDGSSTAFSATQLGPSIFYAGVAFPLGTPAVPDAASDATIALPPGNYQSVYLIGAGANGAQMAQPFTITYSDGSTSQSTLSLSSWNAPQNFPGETIVAATNYADTAQGTRIAGAYDLYGYTLPVDPTRVAQSLTLPPTANVIVLAAGLEPQALFQAPGQYAYTPAAGAMLPLGTNPLSVAFIPTSGTLFTGATGSTSLVVEKPTLTLTANSTARVYGTANPVFTGSIRGALPSDTLNETFSSPATTLSPAGTYAIVPAAVGSDASLYTQDVMDGTLTITKAPVTVSVTASASSTYQNQPVVLTANVASTTSGTPTQTVQFIVNGASVGSATLQNGTAQVAVALALGTDTVSASYSGDANFLAASSTTQTSISVAPLDFTLTAPAGTSFSAAYGQAGTLLLHVAPVHGVFAGPVSLHVMGELPALATDSFSPSTVPAAAGPTDITLMVHTNTLQSSDGASPGLPVGLCLLILPFALLTRSRRRRRLPYLAAILCWAVLLLGGLALTGCGSGYHTVQFPLVVQASDGTTQHNLTVTLVANTP